MFYSVTVFSAGHLTLPACLINLSIATTSSELSSFGIHRPLEIKLAIHTSFSIYTHYCLVLIDIILNCIKLHNNNVCILLMSVLDYLLKENCNLICLPLNPKNK